MVSTANLWHLYSAVACIYIVTLSIFPGFLAEDVSSDALGDWYPVLLITAFNAADLARRRCARPLKKKGYVNSELARFEKR